MGDSSQYILVSVLGFYVLSFFYVCGVGCDMIEVVIDIFLVLLLGLDILFCQSLLLQYILFVFGSFDVYVWSIGVVILQLQIDMFGFYIFMASYYCGI